MRATYHPVGGSHAVGALLLLSAVTMPEFEMVADFTIQVGSVVFQNTVNLQAVINAAPIIAGVAGWLCVDPVLAVVAAMYPDTRLF